MPPSGSAAAAWLPGTGSAEVARRELPPLHVVTDDAVLARTDFRRQAEAVLRSGGAAVALHLRAPTLPTRLLYRYVEELAPVAAAAGALLLVNDRVDVALAGGAAGVQLGQRGIPATEARRLLGTERWLGVSVHSAGEAREALGAAPDFLLVGTLYETASHPGRPGAGVGILRELSELGVPRIGIGGISPERVSDVRSAGAHGVAMVRGVWGAEEPARAVEVYLQQWNNNA